MTGQTASIANMARLSLEGGFLKVRLNILEKLAACQGNVEVPVQSIENVRVVRKPYTNGELDDVQMGFAARGAPGRGIATIGPRAKTSDGKRVLVVVYLNRPSVVVELAAAAIPWGRLIISTRDAEQVAKEIRLATNP